eukprot:3013062-Prymnesium_polylepis.3
MQREVVSDVPEIGALGVPPQQVSHRVPVLPLGRFEHGFGVAMSSVSGPAAAQEPPHRENPVRQAQMASSSTTKVAKSGERMRDCGVWR